MRERLFRRGIGDPLCCAMLCYAMLYYATLCYAMLCYAMLCYTDLAQAQYATFCLRRLWKKVYGSHVNSLKQ